MKKLFILFMALIHYAGFVSPGVYGYSFPRSSGSFMAPVTGISINAGTDLYTVPQAYINFGLDYPSLPAGFFGPGSDPFTGIVSLKGKNSNGSQNPAYDVSINRTAPVTFGDPPSMGSAPIGMVLLSMVSSAPVVIHYDFHPDSFFDVYFELKSIPQPPGMANILLTDSYGGSFGLMEFFQPVITFVNTANPSEVYTFDPDALSYPPLHFMSSTNCPWTLSPINGEVDIRGYNFILTGVLNHVCFKPYTQQLDFGDAPDPTYPTLLASNGARHQVDGITFLGTLIDAEANGQPTATANGDDQNNLDDEDGVTFLWPLAAGNPCKIKVKASVGDAFLNVWIDFNRNGSWADAGEQIFVDKNLIAGDNYLTFITPLGVVAGPSYARFRFSHQPALSYTGYAYDGEVEDYAVDISEFGEHKWMQQFETSLPGLHSDQAGWVGDDWICSGGHVTDIHWWGNYETDNNHLEERGQGINNFLIKLYSNSNGLPGTVLQTYTVPFSSITEVNTGILNNEMSTIYYYQYNLSQDFIQTQGVVYWISIQAISNNSNPPFNAVWRWQEANRWYSPISYGAASKTPTAPWITITWGSAPYQFSDMAFIITSQVQQFDFGDAPDPGYPTLLASNGARHTNTGLKLGNLIDVEPNGQPNGNATGDDINPVGANDEDGIWWPCNFVPGQTNTIKVTTSGPGFLNAWIDWNADGDWADPGEQVFTNVSLLAGVTDLFVTVPANAAMGTTFARFRYSSQQGISYTGYAPDGEVEDYSIIIQPPVDMDYGDAPDSYQTLAASNGARHARDPNIPIFLGNLVDWEINGQPTPNANGDDNNNLADEDGIAFNTPWIPGKLAVITVNASIGGGGFQGWVDFNADGDWADPGEQIFTNVILVAGPQPLNFNVPATAVTGNTYARFRYSTMGNLSYYGCAPNGEVEDYMVLIIADSLSLQNITVASGTDTCFEAVNKIKVAGNGTSFIVQNGGSATMMAGQSIIYLPTTKAYAGAYMHGFINTTGQTCYPTKSLIIPVNPLPVDEEVAINEETRENGFFKVYPNPTTGNLTLELKDKAVMASTIVEVYNMMGSKILLGDFAGQSKYEISLGLQSPGVYIFRVLNGKKSGMVKVVKQ